MDEINTQDQVEIEREHNEQCALRRKKLGQLRAAGQAYPNDFTRDAFASDLHDANDALDTEALQERGQVVSVAGRMMTRRIMGKASFATIQDMSLGLGA